jgi:hypothetical protein
MNRKEQMRELMQQIFTAHKEFSTAWDASKSANFKSGETYELFNLSPKEINEMLSANHQAYMDARPKGEKLYGLLKTFFENFLIPVMPPFLEGQNDAIDQILDFLEIDISAFRLGYQKEYF